MTTITVYDPAMCCSTGICGTDVDQRLVDLAADLDWLKAKGVRVQRFGLSREPAEFVANDTIRQIMKDSEGDDLPVCMMDGALKAKARYPGRAELADWTGLPVATLAVEGSGGDIAKTSSCCSPAKAASASPTGCCGGGAKAEPAEEKAGSCS